MWSTITPPVYPGHPVSLLRADLAASGRVTTADLVRRPDGKRVRLAGLVLVRRRPGTAEVEVFITLEDETGAANIIVWPDVFENIAGSCSARSAGHHRPAAKSRSGDSAAVAEELELSDAWPC